MQSGLTWTRLIRPQGHPHPPISVSPCTELLIVKIGWILLAPILPFYAIHLTLCYCITPRPFPAWTWNVMIRNRVNRLHNLCTSAWLPPERKDEWSIPPEARASVEEMKQNEMDVSVVCSHLSMPATE